MPTPKLNNNLLKTGDRTKQDDVPISGSGRNSFAEETTMRSKKRESSISLGIFTCLLGLVTESVRFDLAVKIFSRFSIAFSRFYNLLHGITDNSIEGGLPKYGFETQA